MVTVEACAVVLDRDVPHSGPGVDCCQDIDSISFFLDKALIVDEDVARVSEKNFLHVVHSHKCLVILCNLWLHIHFKNHFLATFELQKNASVDVFVW